MVYVFADITMVVYSDTNPETNKKFRFGPRIAFNLSNRNVALQKSIAKVVIDYMYSTALWRY
jgi:hypothetical protein